MPLSTSRIWMHTDLAYCSQAGKNMKLHEKNCLKLLHIENSSEVFQLFCHFFLIFTSRKSSWYRGTDFSFTERETELCFIQFEAVSSTRILYYCARMKKVESAKKKLCRYSAITRCFCGLLTVTSWVLSLETAPHPSKQPSCPLSICRASMG